MYLDASTLRRACNHTFVDIVIVLKMRNHREAVASILTVVSDDPTFG